MSLLFKVLFVSACKGTHHKLALDSLRFLRGPHSENWRNLFVKHYILLLSGSKAPDAQFKDFRNHVLHVKENFWGGALSAANAWYQRTVESFANQSWLEAIYAAGVLSHYVTDPFMPLHTGQTEAEGKVHRAAEWSVACSYSELQQILETDLGGYPPVDVPDGPDWLAKLIRAGALSANEHYDAIIEHYNLALGVKNPPLGLDQELKDRIAKQIGLATVTFARVLDRAFADSGTTPPDVFVTLEGILATLQMPVHWITKKLHDMKERAAVEAIYDEVQQTGKALVTLPEDEKVVRALHAKEVLKKPLTELDAEKPQPTGTQHGKGAGVRWRLSLPVVYEPRISAGDVPAATKKSTTAKAPPPPPQDDDVDARASAKVPPPPKGVARVDEAERPLSPPRGSVEEHEGEPDRLPTGDRFYLELASDVVDAPSIGPKTARRLEAVKIHTVNDLIEADAEQVAKKLNLGHVDARKVREWQAQAALVCRVPDLRGHDAQILVGSGVTSAEQLAEMKGRDLLFAVEPFCQSTEGERVLRGGKKPDLNEVMGWIRSGRRARALQEA